MRVFVGYGYGERDRWIEGLVFDLVRSFGFEVVSGKEIYGSVLSDGVKATLGRSHAMLGFTTRREDANGQQNGTHRWVTDELATAFSLKIPFVEVREANVNQGGIVGDRQYIPYAEAERDKCLVEIAKALGIWRQVHPIRVKLIPDELINRKIQPNLRKGGFRCTYKLLEGVNESQPENARILPIKGGLFVEIPGVSSDVLVAISVEYAGQIWTSAWESVDTPSIELQE